MKTKTQQFRKSSSMKIFSSLFLLMMCCFGQSIFAQESFNLILKNDHIQSIDINQLFNRTEGAVNFTCSINGDKSLITLDEKKVLTENFEMYAASTEFPLNIAKPKTYKGNIAGKENSHVYLTINQNYFCGLVSVDDEYFSFENINEREIKFTSLDAKIKNPIQDVLSEEQKVLSDQCLEVVINTMNTYKKYVEDGSSFQSTLNHNVRTVNEMEEWYYDFNIKSPIDVSFVLNEVQLDDVLCEDHFRKRDFALQCYYGNGGFFLQQFEDWIESDSQDPNPTGFNSGYDVATLWIASSEGLPNINGQAIPHNHGGEVCDDRPYNYCRARTSIDAYVLSHEVGHNLGATDLNSGNTIMSPGVSYNWADISIDEILDVISGSCLNSGEYCYTAPYEGDELTGTLSSCCFNEGDQFSTLSIEEELLDRIDSDCDINDLNYTWKLPFGYWNTNDGVFEQIPSGPSITVLNFYTPNCGECQSDNPLTVEVVITGDCLKSPITLTQEFIPCCGPPEVKGNITPELYADDNGCLSFRLIETEEECYDSFHGTITNLSQNIPFTTEEGEDGKEIYCFDPCADAWLEVDFYVDNDCGSTHIFSGKLDFPDCFGNNNDNQNSAKTNIDENTFLYPSLKIIADNSTDHKLDQYNSTINLSPELLVKNRFNENIGQIQESEIMIYPNPADDMLMFNAVPINTKINIRDTQGRIVKNLISSNENQVINIEGINNGMYVVIFYQHSGDIITRKLVINHK